MPLFSSVSGVSTYTLIVIPLTCVTYEQDFLNALLRKKKDNALGIVFIGKTKILFYVNVRSKYSLAVL